MKKCWTFSSGYDFGYGTEQEKPMTLSLCTSRDFLPEEGHGGAAEGGRAWKGGSNFVLEFVLVLLSYPSPFLLENL